MEVISLKSSLETQGKVDSLASSSLFSSILQTVGASRLYRGRMDLPLACYLGYLPVIWVLDN